MKKIVIAVLALACAGVLLVRAADAVKPQEDAEEAGVMIDSRGEAEADDERPAPAETGPAGIPSSYGQCRGVMADGGRNLLVFESIEDGSISFVQVTTGKGVSWRLVGRIQRSND